MTRRSPSLRMNTDAAIYVPAHRRLIVCIGCYEGMTYDYSMVARPGRVIIRSNSPRTGLCYLIRAAWPLRFAIQRRQYLSTYHWSPFGAFARRDRPLVYRHQTARGVLIIAKRPHASASTILVPEYQSEMELRSCHYPEAAATHLMLDGTSTHCTERHISSIRPGRSTVRGDDRASWRRTR